MRNLETRAREAWVGIDASAWGPAGARRTLAAAMAVAVVVVLWWGADRTFALDEWDYVLNRGDWTVENLLRPTNGHLLALPLVVYKALLSIFGAGSHLPFTLLSIVLQLLVAGLLYVLAARRMHPWLALIPAVLILFYGAGWEVLINTASMQNQFAIAAGLGAFLCLDRRRDGPAALLLGASLASFTIGLAFAAGAGVRLLVEDDPRGRFRRIWIAAGPVLLWLAWFVWARRFHQESGSLRAVGVMVGAVFDQLSAILGGLTGLFQRSGPASAGSGFLETTDRTGVLTFALIGAIAWRAARPPRISAAACGALATLLVYLLLIGAGLGDARFPDASRYVYMGSLLMLVVGIELTAGLRPGRRLVLAVLAVAAVSLYANLAQLYPAGKFFEDESSYNRAELGALEIAGPVVDPAFVVEPEPSPTLVPHQDLVFPAIDFLHAFDRFGSPADTETELAAEPEAEREAADDVSIRALGVEADPVPPGGAAPAATPLNPEPGLNANVIQQGACLAIEPSGPGSGYAFVGVPAGGVSFRARDGVELGLRRFADGYTSGFAGELTSGMLRIPADLSDRPWEASFAVSGPARVCPA